MQTTNKETNSIANKKVNKKRTAHLQK